MCSASNETSSWNWKCPDTRSKAQLHLYNSFTQEKNVFVPTNGNEVRLYNCGSTFDDNYHIGHARYFISVDILRRILTGYFRYDIVHCMNIIDIDDRFIEQAHRHNLDTLIDQNNFFSCIQILEHCRDALKHLTSIRSREPDKNKKRIYNEQISAANNFFNKFRTSSNDTTQSNELFDDNNDILLSMAEMVFLCTTDPIDNHRFIKYFNPLEQEFMKQMKELNVLGPNIVTHSSDYVPEIVNFIEKIMKNGYAYESNGSIYFDTIKFRQEHPYPKLEADRMNDIAASNEEKPSTTVDITKEKKNKGDFTLWKKSKPGEPVWQSPWGPGRPGWQIQCAVVSSTILGPQMDIHAGRFDVELVHNNDQLAQSEAYFNNHWCVNYFLQIGNLIVCGEKMSKSSGNVVTIVQLCRTHTPTQMRILFLLNLWTLDFDYCEPELKLVVDYELNMVNCLDTIKSHLDSSKKPDILDGHSKYSLDDLDLNEHFSKIKEDIHMALCDSFDTPSVMIYLANLWNDVKDFLAKDRMINIHLIHSIYNYILHLLEILGISYAKSSVKNDKSSQSAEQQKSTSNVKDIVMPYVEQFTLFREAVRTQAIAANHEEILRLCDQVKNEILPELGVEFEDQADMKRPTIKFHDPELLKLERQQELLVEKREQFKKNDEN